MLAFLHPMKLKLVRFCHCLQHIPFMTGLPTAFLATGFSQTLRFLPQPIARGWFANVAAVLGDLIFQSLEAFC